MEVGNEDGGDIMSRTEIRFRGVGGQGIITMGYIIGRAAAIYDKRKVLMSEFYGLGTN